MSSDTDRDGLLADIIKNPTDDTPRKIYADWLLDSGDQARVDFIQLQVKGATLPDGSPERATLDLQANTLLTTNRAVWEQPLIDLGVTAITWERGFPISVNTSADNFITNGGKIIAIAPITQATISGLNTGQM